MSTGLQRIHAGIVIIPMTILSIIIIGLAGASYEDVFSSTDIILVNAVSTTLMSYAVPAATVALAAAIGGACYAMGKPESWVAAATALSTALVAWAFGLIVFGFACKQSAVGGELAGKLKGLSGICIILFLVETIYVAVLHLIVAPSGGPTGT
ncbi:hypothetical protein Mapa_005061 [Marchantia paleacea]|nr:hypothetical protein Mapa_005061 [Marchantia paleacea]